MENITPSYTKTITFSADQIRQVQIALHSRIESLEKIARHGENAGYGENAMVLRDKIEVAKQALAAVEA